MLAQPQFPMNNYTIDEISLKKEVKLCSVDRAAAEAKPSR